MNVPKSDISYVLSTVANIRDLTKEGRLSVERTAHQIPALLYYLHTLTEVMMQLPPEAKAQFPYIKWSSLSGFRNRLVHNFKAVNFDVVWGVVDNELEKIKAVAEILLRQAEEGHL